jgi:hypothetical protein
MLRELTASTRRLALVGLAKNTGKTVALAVLLRELEEESRTVGVTSVGRDGEERDVIDSRISKPRVHLPAGSLVATTDALLRSSALRHELLEATEVRTPLGEVLIARLLSAGAIEVAGPSAAGDVRAVSDSMLGHGAVQILIDGAVDRRAASSPEVADGLVLSTGAVLSHDIAEVALQTKDAVDLVRLPSVDDEPETGDRLRALADASGAPRQSRESLFVGTDFEAVALPPRFVLTSDAEQIAQLLDENPAAHWLIVAGALPDRFLRGLLHPLHHRGRELVLVVTDPTSVFLWKRGPEWYARQGVHLRTLNSIALQALTVNPVAPQSHRFDSARLRALLKETIDDVPIFDVLDPSYAGGREPAPLA